MDNTISLNKFISDTGYCSRREADELIKMGRVLLNNKTAQLGNRFKPGDHVEVDGSLITVARKEKSVYLAFNKPLGVTTTTEEHVKGNIISFIGFPKRIFPIGRLDKDSEGLIFLTNDGDIVNKLLRAGNAHEKEYTVRVNKPIAPGFAEQMAAGIPMLDTVTLPCKVKVTGRQSFNIILTQGLNRQIRRMCEYMGYAVEALQRIRIMSVKLDKIPSGKWRYLSETEIQQLMESVKDSSGEAVKSPARAKTGTRLRSDTTNRKPAFRKEPGPRDKSRFGEDAAAGEKNISDKRRATVKEGSTKQSGPVARSGSSARSGSASRSGSATKSGSAAKLAPGSRAGSAPGAGPGKRSASSAKPGSAKPGSAKTVSAKPGPAKKSGKTEKGKPPAAKKATGKTGASILAKGEAGSAEPKKPMGKYKAFREKGRKR